MSCLLPKKRKNKKVVLYKIRKLKRLIEIKLGNFIILLDLQALSKGQDKNMRHIFYHIHRSIFIKDISTM